MTDELHDIVRWCARHEPWNVFEIHPAATRDFIARTRLGASGDIAIEDVMMLLLASEVEEILGRLAGELCFLLEFSKRGVREMLPALEDSAWQGPFRLATCH